MSKVETVRHHTIIEVEPHRCIPWEYHNRDKSWLSKENCLDLISSIQNNGQVHPVLVRKIQGNPSFDYELIYGVRRWFACMQIPEQKLLARLIEVDDKTAAILMHTENADSKDISEFERAFSFAQQLRSGIFKNQTEMAKAMGVTQGLISRMIKASELFQYDWLKELISNKMEIKIKPAYKLISLMKDKQQEILIKSTAEKIAERLRKGEKISTDHIIKSLLQAGMPKANVQLNKEIRIPFGNQTIHCKQEPNGKIVMVIDKLANNVSRETLFNALSKAVDQFILPR